ncbi:MAG: hypothetical protein JW774_09625, partial [Candidatus Aureabacteria bacterium]|nr:hypothetical protein [Candidatus Auribacterota bacterium]
IPIGKRWSLGVGYETSRVDEKEVMNAVTRDAATFRYNFLEPETVRLFGKVEYREDKDIEADTKTEHVYLENSLNYRMWEDLDLILKGALGYAKTKPEGVDQFDFKQASLGFAYRPKQDDRMNLLGKVTHTEDLPLENRSDFLERSQQKKDVFSLDSVFDFTETIQLVGKIAYRSMSEKTGNRAWVDSETWLWVNGLNIKFFEKWRLGGEYRILDNTTFDDRKTGFLIQLGRVLSDSMILTAGYNFTSFDDNLCNRDEYDLTGFFIRIEGRY